MTKLILIDQRGTYLKYSFKVIASKAWNEFFRRDDESCDIAHWVIEADSGTIKLTRRDSSLDEDDPGWKPPTPIIMLVDGIVELFDTGRDSSFESLRNEFNDWAVDGILKSFNSAGIQKKYNDFSIESPGDFAIVTAPREQGLSEDRLSLIWPPEKSLTLKKIMARQSAAKRRALRKPKMRVKKKAKKKK